MSKNPIPVSPSGQGDSDTVGRLVHALIRELAPEGRETPAPDEFIRAATMLLTGGFGYWAFLARDPLGEPVGVVTLNECAATYARGRFGEVAELYVVPAWRSSGVGAALLVAARAFGQARGWRHLEVGAPAVPRFRRTVDFYHTNGFVEVGPRLRCGLAGK